VRLTETLSLPCVSKRRTSKTNGRLLQKVEEEKNLCRASVFKTHGRRKIRRTTKIHYRAFFMTHGKEALCRAPDKRRTTKI
jgi:hypothetical protein